jgi:hypothetical protein
MPQHAGQRGHLDKRSTPQKHCAYSYTLACGAAQSLPPLLRHCRTPSHPLSLSLSLTHTHTHARAHYTQHTQAPIWSYGPAGVADRSRSPMPGGAAERAIGRGDPFSPGTPPPNSKPWDSRRGAGSGSAGNNRAGLGGLCSLEEEAAGTHWLRLCTL